MSDWDEDYGNDDLPDDEFADAPDDEPYFYSDDGGDEGDWDEYDGTDDYVDDSEGLDEAPDPSEDDEE